MRVFEVSLNRERLCTAGIDGDGVVSAILSDVKGKGRDNLDLAVGGLVSATEEHVNWTRVCLDIGDEVRVRIVESESADEPETRQSPQPERDIERRKNWVREMAAELGWTLTEPPGSARPN